jgi:uncharacterized membrane protein
MPLWEDTMKLIVTLLVLQVGIVASYVQSDWEADMNLAKAIGIDGFALNIGESGECYIDSRFNGCVLFRKGYLQ